MVEPAVDLTHGHAHDDHAHHGPQGWLKYLWSTDHKVIAMQYMFTGMFMALVGGFMAYVFRMQLAFPGSACRSSGWSRRANTTPSSPITARS